MYPKKALANKIALGILALVGLGELGILNSIVNLEAFNLFGLSIFKLLKTVGILWVAWGLYKHKIGD